MRTPSFDIIVVASRNRPSLIIDHLVQIRHQISYTPDYPVPQLVDTTPRVKSLIMPKGAGPYRCFRGHQDAMSLCRKDAMLVFEDDAVPNSPDWMQIAEDSTSLLDRYEIVSLHGRKQKGISKSFHHLNRSYNILSPVDVRGTSMVYQLGALAYLLRPSTADKIRQLKWDGFPIDFIISNDFSFTVLAKSPFDHDRRHGSLVEHA